MRAVRVREIVVVCHTCAICKSVRRPVKPNAATITDTTCTTHPLRRQPPSATARQRSQVLRRLGALCDRYLNQPTLRASAAAADTDRCCVRTFKITVFFIRDTNGFPKHFTRAFLLKRMYGFQSLIKSYTIMYTVTKLYTRDNFTYNNKQLFTRHFHCYVFKIYTKPFGYRYVLGRIQCRRILRFGPRVVPSGLSLHKLSKTIFFPLTKKGHTKNKPNILLNV